MPSNPKSFRVRGLVFTSRAEMYENIVMSLGGRMAEKLFLDDISTGASGDIQQASSIARDMVMRYGMSERLGPISYDNSGHSIFIGRDFGQTKSYSEETAGMIENVTIENVTASKAVRRYYPHPDSYVYPLIFIEAEMCLKDITVRNMVRKEYINPIDTFFIGNSSTVDGLTLENIRTENYTGKQMTFFLQYGSVDRLTMKNVVTVSDI